jgi:hypothetical protein
VLARLLIIAALLLAQRAALAHSLWHLDATPGEPAQRTLCDFHDVLGTVVGGADAPLAAQPLPEGAHAPAKSEGADPQDARRLIRGSRGPPYCFPK